jgi:hypothetical protein
MCRRCSGSIERSARERDFDNGIRAALERLLTSPDFLFRIEADPAEGASGNRVSALRRRARLAAVVLSLEQHPGRRAARPRDSRQAARSGVLDQQVRRMLADLARARALVDNFFGQWLQTRNVWLLTPDANTSSVVRRQPAIGDGARDRAVSRRSAEADRGIADLLTADSTFLNEQLARHYGIAGCMAATSGA